jgi:hypothetical protein
MREDRGQAYTLEGIISAILIAGALVVGLQAVDISPWTDDGTDAQTEALRDQVEDVLAAASDRDSLRTIVTCIDGDGDGTPYPAVAAGDAPNSSLRTPFSTLLNRTLDANGYSYEVSVDRINRTGDGLNRTLVTPERDVTRPSVTVTRRIALFDSDPVYRFDPDRGACVPALGSNATLGARYNDTTRDIYITNRDVTSDVYAVVRVRMVAW